MTTGTFAADAYRAPLETHAGRRHAPPPSVHLRHPDSAAPAAHKTARLAPLMHYIMPYMPGLHPAEFCRAARKLGREAGGV